MASKAVVREEEGEGEAWCAAMEGNDGGGAIVCSSGGGESGKGEEENEE